PARGWTVPPPRPSWTPWACRCGPSRAGPTWPGSPHSGSPRSTSAPARPSTPTPTTSGAGWTSCSGPRRPCAAGWPTPRPGRRFVALESEREHEQGPVTLRGRMVHQPTADQRLLDSRGPTDWVHTDPWRVLRIQSEFVEGFGTLSE